MKKWNHTKLALNLGLMITMLVLSGCGRMMHRMMHRMDRMHGERFGEMHEFGEGMMPFGLGQRGDREMMVGVSHIFEPTEDGAVYQLIAEDVEDVETIAMIQDRLSQQVAEMNAGIDALAGEDGEEADEESAEDAEEGAEEDAEAEDGKADGESRHGRHGDERYGERRHSDGDQRGVRGPWMQGLGAFMGEIDVAYSDLRDGGEIVITSGDPDVVEMIHGWIEDGPMERRGGRK